MVCALIKKVLKRQFHTLMARRVFGYWYKTRIVAKIERNIR